MAPSARDLKAVETLRTEGNSLFKAGKWGPAIDRYTEAITLHPDLAVLYVNRAMCHKKRAAWAAVYNDSKHALELQGDLMKAHYLLGLACRHQHDLETATKHLLKALEAARVQNDGIKDEIWHELATAKYELWEVQAQARQEERGALRQQLAGLLLGGGSHARGPTPRPPGSTDRSHAEAHSNASSGPLPPPAAASCRPGGAATPALPPAWERLMAASCSGDVKGEAPSLFTCSLTMEIFREPMLSPSGHSFERSALLEHLAKVGQFDPLTRQPISEKQCIPNLGLRAAVQLYLDEHPWAWKEAAC